MSRVLAVARKELLQLRRDRLTVAMMFVLPMMQLLLFGYAINTDVRHIPTVVLDHDRSARSRALAAALEASGVFTRVGEVDSYAQVERAFRAGEARVALVLPPRFGADAAGRGATAQLVVDGSDPQTVAGATSTAVALAAAWDARLTVQGLRPGVSVEPTTWYNPDLRTAVFIVPGLVGILLTMTMVMFTSMALARERERGTLEQLVVTPVRPVELMVGKILPYIGVGYVQMTLVLAAGRVVFDVPLVGSLPLLYASAFVFIAASLALGLVFSTLARTQQQAMQMSFFFLLPNILLSGFAFPWDGMPAPARALSLALPLTHFLRVVRGIVLKGSGAADVAPELGWITLILVVLVTVAALRFRKKVA